MPDIVCLGELLIDAFAEKGKALGEAKTLSPRAGGAGANAAVALARLGASVGFIGKVGRDGFGEHLAGLLKSEGVDVTHLGLEAEAPTMLAIVATPSAEEQDFSFYKGAGELLQAGELPEDYITGARAYIYNSVTFAGKAREAALRGAELAKQAGRHSVFDVNLRPWLWPDETAARKWIGEGIARASVLKLNEGELEFITGGTDSRKGAAKLLEGDIELVCVSRGADGVYYASRKHSGGLPGHKVKVVNTTGCGDAFTAGLAYKLVAGGKAPGGMDAGELEETMKFANACGALAATKLGAMDGLPTLDEVNGLLFAGREPRGGLG